MERLKKLFLNKQFLNYTWVSVFVSVLNIFLLWLSIDIFGVPTIFASAGIIGATFVIRYFLYRRFETF